MIKVFVLDISFKLLSKLNPDQIREAYNLLSPEQSLSPVSPKIEFL